MSDLNFQQLSNQKIKLSINNNKSFKMTQYANEPVSSSGYALESGYSLYTHTDLSENRPTLEKQGFSYF